MKKLLLLFICLQSVFLFGLVSGNTTCDFDPSSGVANSTTNGSAQDITIAKYDPTGNPL